MIPFRSFMDISISFCFVRRIFVVVNIDITSFAQMDSKRRLRVYLGWTTTHRRRTGEKSCGEENESLTSCGGRLTHSLSHHHSTPSTSDLRMAQSPDGLQPIIKRSLSPHAAVSNAAARSPSFISSPPPTSSNSPNSSTPNLNTTANNTPPSYFSQSHAGSTPMSGFNSSSSGHQSPNNPPPTPGILLNKHDNKSTTTLKDHRTQSPPPSDLLRVNSPTSASDSGFSSTSQEGGTNSPPPALGSPVNPSSSSPTATMPSHFKPALEAVLTSDFKRSTPSPPSPHCHFAPLPKPDERPQSRRSSIVSGRVKPFIPRPPERSDSMSTAGTSILSLSYHDGSSLTRIATISQ